MKPLRVALVVKPSPSTRLRDGRNMGYWSYAVPDLFSWRHFDFTDGGRNLTQLRRLGFDLVFHEDGGNFGDYAGSGALPVVYLSIDDTLSPEHLRARQQQAARADLILVDHGNLAHFRHIGPPVRQFPYCVNDQLFQPRAKETDIAFYCGTGARKGAPGGVARVQIRQQLHDIAQRHGLSYRSGALDLPQYAAEMGAARLVVNWPRTDRNRPHRVFDALAAGACLVTGELPDVPADNRLPGVHYVQVSDAAQLDKTVPALLRSGDWQDVAQNGRAFVMGNHTWAVRAQQLRQLLHEVLRI